MTTRKIFRGRQTTLADLEAKIEGTDQRHLNIPNPGSWIALR